MVIKTILPVPFITLTIRGVFMLMRIILTGKPVFRTFVFGLLLLGSTLAASGGEPGIDGSQSLTSPPSREEQAMLVQRLQTARKDVEAFAVFAENFRRNGDQKSLAQLQKPVDDYLRMHLNSLLLTGAEQGTLETTRLAAEIMLARTMLYVGLGRREMARESIAETRKRFGAFQKISVEIAGRASTLDEMLRQLEKEASNVPGK
jgi:hypothetical protein